MIPSIDRPRCAPPASRRGSRLAARFVSRLILRFALFAALLNAVAPAMAYALAASRPQVPIDVCATHGGQAFAAAVALLSADQDLHARHGAAGGHCGDCLVSGHCGQGAHGGHVPDGAPPASSPRLPPSAARHDRPPQVADRACASAPRAAAQPRGPPSSA